MNRLAICNELFGNWPMAKVFSFIRELGYTGVEFAPFTFGSSADRFHVSDLTDEQRRTVRRQAQDAGLDVVGLHWLLARTNGFHLTSPDPDVRKATSHYLQQLTQLCHDLGGSLMVLGSPQQRNLLTGVGPAEGMQFAAEVLRAAMPACCELGVTIAVEPLGPAEGNFLLTAEQAIDLIEQVDSPFCRLHLDAKAMSSEARPIPEILRASKDYLVHFHANDPNRLGPGMGSLDFLPIVAALREIGYGGWISVEVFDFAPGPERIARESIEYLRAILGN